MRRLALLWLAGALGCATGGDDSTGGGDGTGGAATTTTSGGNSGCDNSVDLDSDPQNCGACGRTCVIPNGEAACSSGECTLATCVTGFADCDGSVDNGCELAVDCEAGGACSTTCGSTGLLDCADACAPSCALPAESCNLADDDCDETCDNGAIADCRIGVHRAHGANGHFYANTQAEATAGGYSIEALNYFYLYQEPIGDLRPLFRCPKGNGTTFLSTDTACEIGMAPQATVGFISPGGECGSTPLYRLRNGGSGNHFYTVSAGERDNAINNLGFISEGVAGHVWAAP